MHACCVFFPACQLVNVACQHTLAAPAMPPLLPPPSLPLLGPPRRTPEDPHKQCISAMCSWHCVDPHMTRHCIPKHTRHAGSRSRTRGGASRPPSLHHCPAHSPSRASHCPAHCIQGTVSWLVGGTGGTNTQGGASVQGGQGAGQQLQAQAGIPALVAG